MEMDKVNLFIEYVLKDKSKEEKYKRVNVMVASPGLEISQGIKITILVHVCLDDKLKSKIM